MAETDMGLVVHCALLILLIMECCALTCRSEHGPKDEELRKVFNHCLKQQEGKMRDNRFHSFENDWGNIRDEYKRHFNDWEKEYRNGNRDFQSRGNSEIGRNNRDDDKEHRANNGDYGRRDRNENMAPGRHNLGGRDKNGGMNNMGKENRGDSGSDHLRGQDEFLQSEEYDDPSHDHYHHSIKPQRRYRREKRPEMNSGQRSQYNPHSQKNNGNHDHNNGNEGRNSSENSSKEIDKACVLQCFMEKLHMTDDSGMPDRYLVTHALTKDEKNEDLMDFLQESIEECFQLLDNENTEDKCEFAMNLLTCLSEKGKANCDDWSGKPIFMF